MQDGSTATVDVEGAALRQAERPGWVRLGIIGCGAITESAHLPAALSSPLVQVTALVDSSQERVDFLVRMFGLANVGATDYRQVLDSVNAVVLAVPNHLHSPIGVDLLSRGTHVLCEKPLGLTRTECEQLCSAARASNAVLAVGYFTRFFPSIKLLKQLIDSSFLGRIHSFDYEFGTGKGGWAPVSSYNLSRSSAGGGVLIVNGIHFLDRMLYLFGEVQVIAYADDNHGGVEANCEALVEAHLKGVPIQGRITLSKTHKLGNRLRIVGDRGSLELPDTEKTSVLFFPADGEFRHEISSAVSSAWEEENYFRLQLEDFIRSVQSGSEPVVNGEEATKSVALIEQCYKIATPLEQSWEAKTLSRVIAPVTTIDAAGDSGAAKPSSPTPRVLITGASGLVGSRLCEILSLTETGWIPRAFVHSSGTAARIARFNLDFHVGDLRDRESVERAMDGCDAVIHLARGPKGVMIRGLESLLHAAVKHGVSRFVHVSSIAVYGNNPAPESATEAAPAKPTGLEYGDEKLIQEHMVLRCARQRALPVVILRPPNIWGPFSYFSTGVIQRLRGKALPIVQGGHPCNLVYVDNLVQAMLLALTRPDAVGQTFFVTDGEAVSWEECLTDYAELIGVSVPRVAPGELRPPPRSRLIRDSIKALGRVFVSPEFRRCLQRIPLMRAIESAAFKRFEYLPSAKQDQIRARIRGGAAPSVSNPPQQFFNSEDSLIAAQSRTVVHSSEKARRLLGYTAPVSYEEGMELTRAWLRYAHLIPAWEKTACASTLVARERPV